MIKIFREGEVMLTASSILALLKLNPVKLTYIYE